VFGGRLREPISGAASIAPEILELFHAAGVPVHEGYGLSESAGVGTFNTRGATKIGTIGRPVPGTEIRLADDGEIIMRGPQVFAGYWNNPEATAEVLADGWLYTGDLGSIDEAGFVTITGRKKEIIITADGKTHAGEPGRTAAVALDLPGGHARRPATVPGRADHPRRRADHPLGSTARAALRHRASSPPTRPRALIQPVIAEVNARRDQAAQVKKFVILDHDFSPETGELTPTLKVKRSTVEAKYAHVFDALYEQA